MTKINQNPHVNDYQHVAILLIDMISDYEFPDGEKLFEHALPTAKNIAELKNQANELQIPVLYVNDNYGSWQSDFPKIVEDITKSPRGKQIVEYLQPDDDNYFILKPQYSGFFMTPLELLLDYLNVKTLIITGVAGNMCVHFTANDAYMRHYKLYVPSDCVASNSQEENDEALHLMKRVLKAETAPLAELDLEKIKYEWMDTPSTHPKKN
ncbi:isochorismatase family cysteine hydrolase [Salipaludibacillus aurantiacus]|uniref:Nicotinamidase-related amidase n=1 Tax=Salipaludibacillus aurantiacus TaxID=1601833 RepID=A0A1H9WIH5_9BACI|nr:isochorismatase family cysteine hydrolase [Salipaludibacillus aurantiacus]SES33487.1 Nicotinamidase-related amidase [Salipaludibacillus aurantiacus]